MGRWSASHRKAAIFGWLAFVIAAVMIGGAIGTKRLDSDELGVGESGRAQEIVDAGAFADAADETVLVSSGSRTTKDPEFRSVIAEVVRTVSRQEGVSNVTSPLDRGGSPLVSKDGRSALVQFEVSDVDEQATSLVAPVLEAITRVQDRNPEFRVEQFGGASATKALDETVGEDFERAEYTALPITLGILVVIFGAAVAAGIPLLLGLAAVMAAIGLLAVPSQIFPMDEAANSVILLIGLAVGV
ncbi:MAG: MMPL family transporter, partial [Gaiellaceae bacterium]